MEESTGTLLSLALISLAILASVLGRRHGSKKKKRAPGPRRLPLIGNLLHLLSSQPQVALWNLAKKHGPVMSLRLGQVNVVVISSPAAAQEVLREKDLIFASRTGLVATDIILSGNDIAFAPHGENWRKPHGEHEEQLQELRYTRMAIKEGMRLHPVVPLLLPRLCREACTVGGFDVAEGTKVIVNAWAVARSPEHWHDTDEFRPERFEESAPEYKGLQFEFIPFGSGRRMCPGDAFGLAVLELMVVRLLYYFDWSLPNGHELDMDMVVGATARRKTHLLLVSPYKELAAEI